MYISAYVQIQSVNVLCKVCSLGEYNIPRLCLLSCRFWSMQGCGWVQVMSWTQGFSLCRFLHYVTTEMMFVFAPSNRSNRKRNHCYVSILHGILCWGKNGAPRWPQISAWSLENDNKNTRKGKQNATRMPKNLHRTFTDAQDGGRDNIWEEETARLMCWRWREWCEIGDGGARMGGNADPIPIWLINYCNLSLR